MSKSSKIDTAAKWFMIISLTAFLAAAIHQLILNHYYFAFMCAGAAVLVFVPALCKKLFKITISNDLQITYFLFLFASMVLGKVYNLYEIIPIWDKILHVLSGVILAIAGMRLIWGLAPENITQGLPPSLVYLFAFCFALAAGAVWEIYEFSIDCWFHMDAQCAASGVTDTMLDIICDAAGALLFLIFMRLKNNKKVDIKMV